MRALIGLWVFAASSALAVEQREIKITDKWAVVGVIAGTDPRGGDVGIAVLRNTQTSHTYTLSIGDALPNEFGFVLKAVRNRQVEIANGSTSLSLGFAESVETQATPIADEEREMQTSRFIDNYYRGLSDSPIEIFKTERDRDDVVSESDGSGLDGLRLPIRRLRSYGADDMARRQFDRFRSGDSPANDTGAADADSDNSLISNFSDVSDDRVQDADAYSEPPVLDIDLLRDGT